VKSVLRKALSKGILYINSYSFEKKKRIIINNEYQDIFLWVCASVSAITHCRMTPLIYIGLLNTNLLTLETIVFCFWSFRANSNQPRVNIIKTKWSHLHCVVIEGCRFRACVPRGFV